MSSAPFRDRIFDFSCWLAGTAANFAGVALRRPVFIIGTGRCGTTLLVDILSTHPQLSGFPGEANELWHCKLEPFDKTQLNIPPIEVDPKSFSETSIASWPRNHGATIRKIFTGFSAVTGQKKIFFTKSAMVCFMIPKIIELFPDARFIHIYRFGPSVVESYFKKNFGKYLRFHCTAKEYRAYCARYWNACLMEIERRKHELSLDTRGQFLEFSYEKLCDTPKEILGQIAKFVGVTSDGFHFDVSKVSSQNYKVADNSSDPESGRLLQIMSPGMGLKNYRIGRPYCELSR